jgi:hypothetical protein
VETNEISLHQVQVYEFVAAADRWVTAKECAAATGVKYRTVATHMKRLVRVRIFEIAELFPANHYRLSPFADGLNRAYLHRLITAKAAFSGAVGQ